MRLTRRVFLKRAAVVLGAAAVTPYGRVLSQTRFDTYPFTLGVASGYPHASGMTLWTRLAPHPLEGGGLGDALEVAWEVAEDERFSRIAARGSAFADPQWGHSVHVDVATLRPARPYWYRFRAGNATSPTGRTFTSPEPRVEAARLRFAFASCQQYEQGYFVAYRHMAREDLDLVVHLGDYIYESTWGRNLVRAHGTDAPVTLAEYRNRYALYKSDEDLKAAHSAFPWIVTWDDHEVQNDYANDRSENLDPREAFLARRAAAYQAYYEHMPVPAWARPHGPDMRLYSKHAYGALAQFFVLDTRQYRSHQVCAPTGRGGSTVVRAEDCLERLAEAQTMLGSIQETWLNEGLARSSSRWNVIAQTTLMAQSDRRPGPGADYWTDGWDGYPRARERLLRAIARHRLANPLVISGDVHMSAIADLKLDFDDPSSATIATEFVAPSITAQGPSQKRVELILQENPHIKFANGALHGYTTLEITRSYCVQRIRTVATVKLPDASIRDLTVYAVESGRPGAFRWRG